MGTNINVTLRKYIAKGVTEVMDVLSRLDDESDSNKTLDGIETISTD